MTKRILFKLLGGSLLALILLINHASLSDDIVKSHFNRFMKIAKECEIEVNDSELRIEVDYKHPKNSYYAVTYPTLNLISINYRKYMWLSEIEQEQVILHELGHALLQLDHEDNDLNIMNTKGFIDEKTYSDYYDYFIRKLFKNCNKPLVEKFVHESN